MTDKKFTAVWDVIKGYNPNNLLSNASLNESIFQQKDVEPHFLFFENDEYKIYILKINPYEVSENNQKYFFQNIETKNIYNKKLIFINPTETVSGDYIDVYPNNKNHLFVYPDRWQGVGTFLYTKSMFDGLEEYYNTTKFETILNQNYRPFNITYLVRRGHNRRYEFFKHLESKKNKNSFLAYKNVNNEAKSFEDEKSHLNFNEKDGLIFPYQSHEVIQPIDLHAAFDGYKYMYSYICLLSMAKFNLVVESNSYEGALTEKSMYPFIAKTIPILTNGKIHIEMLENMGFYTFVDELGIRDILNNNITYDINSNNTEYLNKYFDVLDKVVNGDFDYLYETHLDKIEHNYNRCFEIQKGKF